MIFFAAVGRLVFRVHGLGFRYIGCLDICHTLPHGLVQVAQKSDESPLRNSGCLAIADCRCNSNSGNGLMGIWRIFRA